MKTWVQARSLMKEKKKEKAFFFFLFGGLGV
jgi:hypothetical protein